MLGLRRLGFLVVFLLSLLPGIGLSAQTAGPAYTSIVIFGDSLCDTGNDATLSAALYTTAAQVPGPASGYTNGRFTDGLDTLPAARNYLGVWVEQLAAKLAAHPTILNSLAGGTNYAYGFATTAVGTSNFTYGPGNALSFTVPNMGLQLSTYLATHPVITSKTLFIVWGGANDLIAATTPAQIQTAAQNEAGIVQQLIAAGATDILVPNLPPLGLVPRFNGSPSTSVPATAAAQGFNQALAAYLAAIPVANPGVTLHLYQLDTYTFFNTVVGPPIGAGLANVTAESQGNTAIDPDTYLFWDDLHPTTYGHRLLAAQALTLIGTPVTTSSVLTPSNSNVNLNASVTFTDVVTAASGTPIGTVSFMDGTTVLGSVLLSGTTTSATAAFTTSTLAAGVHSITAVYTGVNGYVGSTGSTSETVTAPALTSSFVTSSITIARGSSGSGTLTLTPVGGYNGTATIACGTVPAHFTCSVAPSTITLDGSNVQQTAVISIGTAAMASLFLPARPGTAKSTEILAAVSVFPFLGIVGLAAVRRRRAIRGLGLAGMLMVLSLGAVAGLSGCSSAPSNDAAPGTYTIPTTVTANGTTTTVNLTVVVQ